MFSIKLPAEHTTIIFFDNAASITSFNSSVPFMHPTLILIISTFSSIASFEGVISVGSKKRDGSIISPKGKLKKKVFYVTSIDIIFASGATPSISLLLYGSPVIIPQIAVP